MDSEAEAWILPQHACAAAATQQPYAQAVPNTPHRPHHPCTQPPQAAADVLAMSSLEVDMSGIAEGDAVTVKWRGKPVFIRHR